LPGSAATISPDVAAKRNSMPSNSNASMTSSTRGHLRPASPVECGPQV
jgi:hypothetical protein